MFELKLRKYFDAFSGFADWDDLAQHFEDVFHDELIVATPNGHVNKIGWMEAVKALLNENASINVISMRERGDKIYYSVTISKGDGTIVKPVSQGILKEGKLVRVEPMLPAEYAKITDGMAR